VESVEVFNIDQFAKANIFQDLAQRDVASREIFQQKNTRVLKNVAPRKLISEDCGFSYRHSIFKEHPEWIILGATLKLNLADPVQSRAKVIEYTKKRTASQDIGSKSAGCIFKNHIPAEGGTVIGAGFLIDKAGLKGRSVGGAKVSDKHANFIVNDGTATARDIKELIGVIKDEVRKIHGVMLEEEVRII
jgi:UDP-N-acetylmuramate dehydrogenase